MEKRKGAVKGFTLVELAIVLVVIGIILGMAIKGKSLMDSAKIRSEVNKLEKMGTAISVYYSGHNRKPGASTKDFFDNLTADGTLKDNDFISDMVANQGYWNFTGCSAGNGAWTPGPLASSPYVCAFLSNTDPVDAKEKGAVTPGNTMSPKFACWIETMLDNKNTKTGDGRGNIGALSNWDRDNDWDCQPLGESATGSYMFRVF